MLRYRTDGSEHATIQEVHLTSYRLSWGELSFGDVGYDLQSCTDAPQYTFQLGVANSVSVYVKVLLAKATTAHDVCCKEFQKYFMIEDADRPSVSEDKTARERWQMTTRQLSGRIIMLT